MVTGTHDTEAEEQAQLTTNDDVEAAVDGVDDAADEGEPAPEYEPGRKQPIDHGTKIRAKVKRGTGTRDQDELLIEGRGEDADEAAADFEAALAKAEEQGWTDRLRDLQPTEEDQADE